MTVTYVQNATGDFRPERIDYTGNSVTGLTTGRSVVFFYEPRPDEIRVYRGGSVVKQVERLKKIETYLGGGPVRDYTLVYDDAVAGTNRSRLTSVLECSASACFNAFRVRQFHRQLLPAVQPDVKSPAILTYILSITLDATALRSGRCVNQEARKKLLVSSCSRIAHSKDEIPSSDRSPR